MQQPCKDLPLSCFMLILIFFLTDGGVDIMKEDLLSSELFSNYLAAINVDTHIMDVTKKSPYPSRRG